MLQRIVVTGGTGLLGTALQKIMKGIYLSHSDVDIRDEESVKRCFKKLKPDIVVHLAANIKTIMNQEEMQVSYDTNVLGTRNVAKYSPKMFYMSTEYVFDGTKGNYKETDYPNPLQFYGLTKLLGEYECRYCSDYVIARAILKPRPYKHAVVPKGMMTSGDYVEKIAQQIKTVIDNFDKMPNIIHIGTGRKLLKNLALETREVGDIDIKILPIHIPLDASLDLSLWNSLI